jgi:hypothetical protein
MYFYLAVKIQFDVSVDVAAQTCCQRVNKEEASKVESANSKARDEKKCCTREGFSINIEIKTFEGAKL